MPITVGIRISSLHFVLHGKRENEVVVVIVRGMIVQMGAHESFETRLLLQGKKA